MKATVNAKNGLNIRKEPRTGAEVIREAAHREELNVSLVHGGWCACEDGFCMCQFVDIVDGTAREKTEEAPEKPASGPDAGNSAPEGAPADNAAGEATTGGEAAELNKLKVPELAKLAKDSGIEVKAGAKKAEIIEAILNAD
ncbi:MAG: Rho termination factor N-terminal domain-containing protein [Gordonibacter sp.]|uniref:Rho termination factor N-terminal domain-containing protein n=1 Tax=Gordonibacter sp. TaxID=1968902 RepID=UPI002FCC96E8